ncbi:hypothetical protein Plhal304r1_c021g0075961 [Plasmopara halstedii]
MDGLVQLEKVTYDGGAGIAEVVLLQSKVTSAELRLLSVMDGSVLKIFDSVWNHANILLF